MLATATSGQAKHHPVYPGTRTVRGAIWDRLGWAWWLTEDALLKSERLRFNYSRNEPVALEGLAAEAALGRGELLRLLLVACELFHLVVGRQ